jgi:hypothetical protein
VELAETVRKDRVRDRSATWKDTELVRVSLPFFLSLFKGQGATAGGDDETSSTTDRPPAPGGRLAQLVRALP